MIMSLKDNSPLLPDNVHGLKELILADLDAHTHGSPEDVWLYMNKNTFTAIFGELGEDGTLLGLEVRI